MKQIGDQEWALEGNPWIHAWTDPGGKIEGAAVLAIGQEFSHADYSGHAVVLHRVWLAVDAGQVTLQRITAYGKGILDEEGLKRWTRADSPLTWRRRDPPCECSYCKKWKYGRDLCP